MQQKYRHGSVRVQLGQISCQRKANWEPRVSMSQAEAVSSPPKDAAPQHLSKDNMSGDRNLYQTQSIVRQVHSGKAGPRSSCESHQQAKITKSARYMDRHKDT